MSLSYGQRKSLAKRALRLSRQWETEARAVQDAHADELAQRRAQRDAERAALDAAAHCDIPSLVPGDAVRDRHGWHRVVSVNATTVTVASMFGTWTDRIPMEKIIETRKAVTA